MLDILSKHISYAMPHLILQYTIQYKFSFMGVMNTSLTVNSPTSCVEEFNEPDLLIVEVKGPPRCGVTTFIRLFTNHIELRGSGQWRVFH